MPGLVFHHFTSLPLRVWSYISGVVGVFALLFMGLIMVKTMLFGQEVPGYSSIMCAILFLGGVQLISVCVLGEYICRLSSEAKERPVYIAKEVYGPLSAKLPSGLSKSEVGFSYNSNIDNNKQEKK